MCQGTDELVLHNTGMIEDLLELRSRFVTVTRNQVRLPANISGIQTEREGPVAYCPEFIGSGNLNRFDCFRSLVAIQGEPCLDGWQVVVLYQRILRETVD